MSTTPGPETPSDPGGPAVPAGSTPATPPPADYSAPPSYDPPPAAPVAPPAAADAPPAYGTTPPAYGTTPTTPPAYGTTPPAYGSAPGYGTTPPAAGYPAAGPGGQALVTESDERTWAMLGHIGGILVGFIAGLIVYLVYKDRSQYLKEQGAEALNFQLTMVIGYVAASVLSVIGIGLLLFPIVWILQIVFGIIAGVAAGKHENYRYPFNIRFVR